MTSARPRRSGCARPSSPAPTRTGRAGAKKRPALLSITRSTASPHSPIGSAAAEATRALLREPGRDVALELLHVGLARVHHVAGIEVVMLHALEHVGGRVELRER